MAMSSLRAIAGELALAFAPLEDAVRDLASFKVFLSRLGWRVESLPPAFSALGGAARNSIEAINALGNDPDLEEIGAAFGGLRELVTAIRGLTDAPSGVDPVPFLAEIGGSIVDLLLVDYLASRAPLVFRLLVMVRVIRTEVHQSTGPRDPFVKTTFSFHELAGVLRDPSSIPERAYGWGTVDLDFVRLSDDLCELFDSLGLGVRLTDVPPDRQAGYQLDPTTIHHAMTKMIEVPLFDTAIGNQLLEAGFVILEYPAEDGHPAGIVIEPMVPSELGISYPISSALSVAVRATSEVGTTFGFVIRPDGIAVRYPFEPGRSMPSTGFEMSLVYAPATPALLLGRPDSTRLELGGAVVSLGASVDGEGIEVLGSTKLEGLTLIVSMDDADGLLSSVIGQNIKVPIPLGLSWSSKTGLGFVASAGFEATFAPDLSLGPISIPSLSISLRGEDRADLPPALILEAAAVINGSIGPVAFTAAGVGLRGALEFEDGNLGPVDAELGFKPPNGVGIEIDTLNATGGGFLAIDSANGRYSGALHLRLYDISVSAFGVIDTRLPDGSKGFSFIILISAEFPPIQLGLGFTLDGVGGAIGLNRTLAKEALDGAVRSGRLDHILFPRDPAAHAPEILSDLQAYFPPAKGRYTFGPLAKIGWAGLVEAKLGLILELPHPVRLTLLGTISAGLPSAEKRLVKLNMAVIGQLDFEKKTFALDASLYDSDVGGFPISGDMALRLAWGHDANFVMAIGGFNSQFQPPPGFPALRRITVDISPGGNPRVTCQAYLAVTSNTAQVGAQAELTAGGNWNIYGWISFDALFVFSPFSFEADFSAGVALRHGTRQRASVTVHGTISGPNPWFVKGSACVSLFFFDICVGFEVTLSERRAEAIPPLPDRLLDVLAPAVNDVRNWSAELPVQADRVVALGASAATALDPLGAAVLRQTALPLEERITRFRSQKLGQNEVATYQIQSVTFLVDGNPTSATASKVIERFARAQFEDVPDAKKLSLPAFETMVAGARVASDALRAGRSSESTVQYATFVVNDPSAAQTTATQYQPSAAVIDALAHQSPAAIGGVRTIGARKYVTLAPSLPKVELAEEAFTIVSTSTLGVVGDSAHPINQALEQAREAVGAVPRGKAIAILTRHLSDHPEDRGEFQVISEDELPVAA
jgi:hypothetical protein